MHLNVYSIRQVRHKIFCTCQSQIINICLIQHLHFQQTVMKFIKIMHATVMITLCNEKNIKEREGNPPPLTAQYIKHPKGDLEFRLEYSFFIHVCVLP